MKCNSCKGRCDLIGYNLQKCCICGKEQPLIFKSSPIFVIKDKLKRFIGLK